MRSETPDAVTLEQFLTRWLPKIEATLSQFVDDVTLLRRDARTSEREACARQLECSVARPCVSSPDGLACHGCEAADQLRAKVTVPP